MRAIACPNCGAVDTWRAIEHQEWATPCQIAVNDDGSLEIEMTPYAELGRELATSTTVMYFCSDESCGYACSPDKLAELKEAIQR